MGILADLDGYRQEAGVEYVDPEPARRKHNWEGLCVCGHMVKLHAVVMGGEYGTFTREKTSSGCRGGTPSRGELPIGRANGMMEMAPTCPCRAILVVAEVDRGRNCFRQRTWTQDAVHPMTRGLKAMTTMLSKQKSITDPGAELDRRFRWMDGMRKCAVCGAAGERDRVWPMFVDDDRNSELRCSRHYVRAGSDE